MDKLKLLSGDYRLFQDTQAWDLVKAVEDKDVVKIKELVRKNKDLLTVREPRFGQPILKMAVMNENYNAVESLLTLGADPNMQDLDCGDSPLMRAANIGFATDHFDSRFLKLLLKYGGDPNAEQHGPHKHGYTPLRYACESNSIEYVKILIDAGANINAVSVYGDVVLEDALVAADLHRNPDLVIYLIKKGVDYKRALYTTIPEGEKRYITNDLRDWRFDLGSEEYKKKMWIVAFLKKNGMDYRKTPIPKQYLDGDYSKEYLEKY